MTTDGVSRVYLQCYLLSRDLRHSTTNLYRSKRDTRSRRERTFRTVGSRLGRRRRLSSVPRGPSHRREGVTRGSWGGTRRDPHDPGPRTKTVQTSMTGRLPCSGPIRAPAPHPVNDSPFVGHPLLGVRETKGPLRRTGEGRVRVPMDDRTGRGVGDLCTKVGRSRKVSTEACTFPKY